MTDIEIKRSRKPCTFKQSDVTPAIRGIAKAGVAVQRVEVDRSGKIVVLIAAAESEPSLTTGNEWDDLK